MWQTFDASTNSQTENFRTSKGEEYNLKTIDLIRLTADTSKTQSNTYSLN